ncbi:MAG: hypothetical protein HYZ73_07860 [Elusimicrobia bacterium]|nr:hypothetical protein [Elusimicrobiota bacterium]
MLISRASRTTPKVTLSIGRHTLTGISFEWGHVGRLNEATLTSLFRALSESETLATYPVKRRDLMRVNRFMRDLRSLGVVPLSLQAFQLNPSFAALLFLANAVTILFLLVSARQRYDREKGIVSPKVERQRLLLLMGLAMLLAANGILFFEAVKDWLAFGIIRRDKETRGVTAARSLLQSLQSLSSPPDLDRERPSINILPIGKRQVMVHENGEVKIISHYLFDEKALQLLSDEEKARAGEVGVARLSPWEWPLIDIKELVEVAQWLKPWEMISAEANVRTKTLTVTVPDLPVKILSWNPQWELDVVERGARPVGEMLDKFVAGRRAQGPPGKGPGTPTAIVAPGPFVALSALPLGLLVGGGLVVLGVMAKRYRYVLWMVLGLVVPGTMALLALYAHHLISIDPAWTLSTLAAGGVQIRVPRNAEVLGVDEQEGFIYVRQPGEIVAYDYTDDSLQRSFKLEVKGSPIHAASQREDVMVAPGVWRLGNRATVVTSVVQPINAGATEKVVTTLHVPSPDDPGTLKGVKQIFWDRLPAKILTLHSKRFGEEGVFLLFDTGGLGFFPFDRERQTRWIDLVQRLHRTDLAKAMAYDQVNDVVYFSFGPSIYRYYPATGEFDRNPVTTFPFPVTDLWVVTPGVKLVAVVREGHRSSVMMWDPQTGEITQVPDLQRVSSRLSILMSLWEGEPVIRNDRGIVYVVPVHSATPASTRLRQLRSYSHFVSIPTEGGNEEFLGIRTHMVKGERVLTADNVSDPPKGLRAAIVRKLWSWVDRFRFLTFFTVGLVMGAFTLAEGWGPLPFLLNEKPFQQQEGKSRATGSEEREIKAFTNALVLGMPPIAAVSPTREGDLERLADQFAREVVGIALEPQRVQPLGVEQLDRGFRSLEEQLAVSGEPIAQGRNPRGSVIADVTAVAGYAHEQIWVLVRDLDRDPTNPTERVRTLLRLAFQDVALGIQPLPQVLERLRREMSRLSPSGQQVFATGLFQVMREHPDGLAGVLRGEFETVQQAREAMVRGVQEPTTIEPVNRTLPHLVNMEEAVGDLPPYVPATAFELVMQDLRQVEAALQDETRSDPEKLALAQQKTGGLVIYSHRFGEGQEGAMRQAFVEPFARRLEKLNRVDAPPAKVTKLAIQLLAKRNRFVPMASYGSQLTRAAVESLLGIERGGFIALGDLEVWDPQTLGALLQRQASGKQIGTVLFNGQRFIYNMPLGILQFFLQRQATIRQALAQSA